MSRFPLKTTYHTKIHGNLRLNEKRQSTDANAEMAEMWQFSDKDIEAVIMKMLKWEKRKSQQRNQRHEEKPNENLELKKAITEKKISLDGLNSKMEMNQWIWRYNHKIPQSDQQGEK